MHITLVDPSNFTLPYDYALAEALCEQGCHVSILKRKNRADEQVAPSMVVAVEHFYRFSETYRSQLQRMRLLLPAKLSEHIIDLSRLENRLSELNTDVVHFQWLIVPWLDKRLLKSVLIRFPTVLSVHDTCLYHGTSNGTIQARGWIDVIRKMENVIVHTKYSYGILRQAGIPKNALTIIPHGALSIGRTTGKNGGRIAKKRCDHHVLTLLLFGHLKAYKGLDTLTDAVRYLDLDVIQRIRIVIAGKPHDEVIPTLERLKSLMPSGSIDLDLRFLPESDLAHYISEASIVLFPYHRIDASGAFMATLPFKKIIIASHVGVFSEYLENRKNGMLFSAGNSRELATHINSVVNDSTLRKSLEEGASELAKKIQNWNEIARQTISIYKRAHQKS